MTTMEARGRHLARLNHIARAALQDLFDQRRPFGRFALVHALQAAGSTLITISLAGSLFFSISPDAAKGKVLLYLLLTIAPFALVGPALSPLLDVGTQARRTAVALANAGSALLCLAMARSIHDLFLFPEAFGVLVLAKLYIVGRAALVPELIDSDHDLATANARLAVLASLAGFLAFPFGVGLLKLGAPWVLRLGFVVFAAGTAAAFRLPKPRGAKGGRHAVVGRDTKAEPGLSRPPSAGEVHAARRVLGLPLYPAPVRAAIIAMSVARGAVGFVEFFLAFELRRQAASSWWFGLLLVASGAGSLLGSVLVPRARRHMSERQIIVAALFAIAAGGLAAALIGGLWAQALLTFVVGVGPMSAKPALDSIVQRHVTPALLGRAFGRLETRLQLTWVLAALSGVVVPFPLRAGDTAVTLVCLIAGATYASGRLARRRQRVPKGARHVGAT